MSKAVKSKENPVIRDQLEQSMDALSPTHSIARIVIVMILVAMVFIPYAYTSWQDRGEVGSGGILPVIISAVASLILIGISSFFLLSTDKVQQEVEKERVYRLLGNEIKKNYDTSAVSVSIDHDKTFKESLKNTLSENPDNTGLLNATLTSPINQDLTFTYKVALNGDTVTLLPMPTGDFGPHPDAFKFAKEAS